MRNPTIAVLVVLSLAIAACGGNDTSSSSTRPVKIKPTTGLDVSKDVEDTYSAVVKDVGEDKALEAALRALCQGYSPQQLWSNATGGTLNDDGTMTNIDGHPSTPTNDPSCSQIEFDDATTVAKVARTLNAMVVPEAHAADTKPRPQSFSDFRKIAAKNAQEEFGDQSIGEAEVDALMLKAILQLATAGYSPDQIIEGFLLDSVTLVPATLFGDASCAAIFNEDRTPVLPVSESSQLGEGNGDRCLELYPKLFDKYRGKTAPKDVDPDDGMTDAERCDEASSSRPKSSAKDRQACRNVGKCLLDDQGCLDEILSKLE